VPVPAGATVGGIGFHDVDYHSGEAYDGTDWAVSGGAGSSLTWSTGTAPAANALRWGTLYNFRFVADAPPVLHAVELGLYRPGTPAAMSVPTLTPRPCDADGICDPGETCSSCAADCLGAGLGACCGDGTCAGGESRCDCPHDCGLPPKTEAACADGLDEDCDAGIDCGDADCCGDGACAGADADGDAFALCDCDDADATIWSAPGAVEKLELARAPGTGTVLTWTAPAERGGDAVRYEAIRSADPGNFVTDTSCLAHADPAAAQTIDTENPAPGAVFYYEVRAQSSCADGEGPLGRGSNGLARVGRSCP
jgi:hypothetical protein